MSINNTVTGPTGTQGMTGDNSTNDWDTRSFIKWVSNGCNINDASKVERLDVTYFGLNLHKAGLFKHFVNLRILDLSQSCLTEIPEEVWELTQLTELYVYYNAICEISPKIKNLTKLKYLDFQNNDLSTFPVEICQLTNLISFNYDDNKLDILDPAVVDFINKIENITPDECIISEMNCDVRRMYDVMSDDDDPIFTLTRLTRL